MGHSRDINLWCGFARGTVESLAEAAIPSPPEGRCDVLCRLAGELCTIGCRVVDKSTAHHTPNVISQLYHIARLELANNLDDTVWR